MINQQMQGGAYMLKNGFNVRLENGVQDFILKGS